MLSSQKYDLIFSLGAACSCTQILRKKGLQLSSYPFDWLFGSCFNKRIDMLTSDFADFIQPEDLEYTGKNNGLAEHLCDIYYNKANDITFNHDFPEAIPLSRSFPSVKEKYMRRCRRLISQINSSRRVLAVWLETPNCPDKLTDFSTLLNGWKKLCECFPNAEIDLLYISNSKTASDEQPHPHIRIVRADYTFYGAEPHVVNPQPLSKILAPYKLNCLLFNPSVQLPFFYKLLLSLFPFRKLRRKLTGKYDER